MLSFLPVIEPKPFGLQDLRIKDDQITASSHVSNSLPQYARLNNGSFWKGSDAGYSWLQVDFLSTVAITKIQTQGGGGFWITHLSVMTGRDENSLVPIMESGSEKVSKSCDNGIIIPHHSNQHYPYTQLATGQLDNVQLKSIIVFFGIIPFVNSLPS